MTRIDELDVDTDDAMQRRRGIRRCLVPMLIISEQDAVGIYGSGPHSINPKG